MWLIFEVMSHCIVSSVKHPRTMIKQDNNPVPLELSPIPWWGSVLIIILGIVSWITSAIWDIGGLGEVARPMVYLPLMHIFDMSWFLAKQVGRSQGG